MNPTSFLLTEQARGSDDNSHVKLADWIRSDAGRTPHAPQGDGALRGCGPWADRHYPADTSFVAVRQSHWSQRLNAGVPPGLRPRGEATQGPRARGCDRCVERARNGANAAGRGDCGQSRPLAGPPGSGRAFPSENVSAPNCEQDARSALFKKSSHSRFCGLTAISTSPAVAAAPCLPRLRCGLG